MEKQLNGTGLPVLNILVERHQQFLEREGQTVTREEAVGRLLAWYCGFQRQKVLEAVLAALQAAELTTECEIIRFRLTHVSHEATA